MTAEIKVLDTDTTEYPDRTVTKYWCTVVIDGVKFTRYFYVVKKK